MKLLFQIGRRSFDSRIHLNRECLLISLAIGVENNGVLPRHDPRRTRLWRSIVGHGGDGILRLDAGYGRMMHVPQEAMHASFARKFLRRTHPIRRDFQHGIDWLNWISAGVSSDH